MSVPLKRLAICRDDLRRAVNATERAVMQGEVPYWGANQVQDYVDKALVTGETVLIGEDGAPFFDPNRDVAFFVNEPIWPNNHIHVLKPLRGTDARWLAYALNSVDFSRWITGSTRDKLTQSDLMRIELPDYPRQMQEAVAAYLDRETATIDALIERQRSLIEGFRERRKAVVEHAILDAEAEAQRLGWCMSTRSGEVPTIDDAGQVPIYGAGRLLGWARLSNARPGELVVGRVGSVGSLRLLDSEAWVSDNAIVCTWDDARVDSRYGCYGMSLVDMRELASGAAMPLLTASKLKKWKIPVPPLDEQRAIADHLDLETAKIDALIAKAERFIELAQERRAALITAAVTGQIDIPAEEPAA